MPMIYDARNNNVRHVEDDDDRVIKDKDDASVLKDGERVRVPMYMMDHDSVQHSVAMDAVRRKSAEDRALYNLDVSNRWRGGIDAIQAGDVVKIGDQTRVVVSHEDGKLRLRDATSADGNALKQDAYDSYDNDIQSRYLNTYDAKAGESCTTAGRERGTWREKDGKLVCVTGGDKSSKSKSENEWAHAGPLSDAQRTQIKDEMYASYDDQIQNAWKR